jgi:hypothetical protein
MERHVATKCAEEPSVTPERALPYTSSPSVVPGVQLAPPLAIVAEELLGNVMEAVNFLKSRPGEHVTLTAIHMDAKGALLKVETRSFSKSDRAMQSTWIMPRNGKANIYYSVNQTLRPMNKKPERTDMARVVSLHADIDPRVGETQEAAQDRIRNEVASYKPEPTWIINSGGGIQVLWDLEDPIEVGGDLAKAEEAKLYNVELERVLGGDACHNIDRLMRLPGTVNVPDARKLRKGRKPALATIIGGSGKAYPLSLFSKASLSGGQLRAAMAGSSKPMALPSTAAPLESLDDDRLSKLPAFARALIVDGGRGSDARGNRYESRSHGLFGCVTAMIRAEVPPDVIYAIITDPKWRISESILDKKNKDREAQRVIGRAKEACVDEDLAAMNDRNYVTSYGGKARVVTEIDSTTFPGRTDFVFQTFDDFIKLNDNRRKIVADAQGRPKELGIGKWWLDHQHRRQYLGTVFAPFCDEESYKGRLNLWQGFSFSAVEGDCSLFLQHLRENICDGDELCYQYAMNWLAVTIQKRDRPGQVAFVMRGKEGVGKSFFARTIGKLLDKHFLPITQKEHLTGKFNSHLETTLFAFVDECYIAGDKQAESVMKSLITEPTFMVEPKGVNPYSARNFLHIMISTNNTWAVSASSEARRYFVLDVPENKMQDRSYFDAIQGQLDAGGYEALLFTLQKRDISDFDVTKVPKTTALAEQKMLTRNGIDAAMEDIIDRCVPPCQHPRYTNWIIAAGSMRGEGFYVWLRDHFPELQNWSPKRIVATLRKDWGFTTWLETGLNVLVAPELADLRRRFETRHGDQCWSHPDVQTWQRAAMSCVGRRQSEDEIPF